MRNQNKNNRRIHAREKASDIQRRLSVSEWLGRRRFFRLFYLNDLAPVIGPAGGAGMMRQYHGMALWTLDQCWRLQRSMT
jgi:hypothetical protein